MVLDDDEEAVMLKKQMKAEEEGESESNSKDASSWSRKIIVEEAARRLKSGDLGSKIEAARDVRRLVRKSSSFNSKTAVRCRFAAAGAIEPLVSMLHSSLPLAAREAALLAILNLAARHQRSLELNIGVCLGWQVTGLLSWLIFWFVNICISIYNSILGPANKLEDLAKSRSYISLKVENKYERNKIKIAAAGAVPPLVELLKNQSGNLRELATAAILSLSSAASNKPTIAVSGAALLLVEILCSGSIQGKVDAVTALYYLSTCEEEPKLVLDTKAVPPLINLLKDCKKYSKFAEKTTLLLEIFCDSEEGRTAITNVEGGILTLVETIEDGSSVSMSHAVGALLSLCQSSRNKYRELILKEGAIPGLLHLTAEGTPTSQDRARALLDMLRDSPPERRLTSSQLERIVYNFAANVDGKDRAVETAKKLLQDMVQKSMDLSLNRTKLRRSPRTSTKI